MSDCSVTNSSTRTAGRRRAVRRTLESGTLPTGARHTYRIAACTVQMVTPKSQMLRVLSESPKTAPRSEPTAPRSSIRTLLLSLLLLQNVLSVLVRRYTLGVRKQQVSHTEILLASELVKGVVCGLHTAKDEGDDVPVNGAQKIVWLITNSQKMAALALLYGVMNVASFIALKSISAPLFTVLVQLKILSTALFAVVILGQRPSATKWRALVLLVCGSLLVVSPAGRANTTHTTSHRTSLPEATTYSAQAIGVAAVIGEVIGSGFASIYFEKVLKNNQIQLSVWARNVQLSFWSTLIFTILIIHEQMQPQALPFGHGWTAVIWLIVMLISAGGVLVALCVKHADSIFKAVVVCGAVAVNAVADHLFLGGPMSSQIGIGVIVTIVAVLNYSLDATPQ